MNRLKSWRTTLAGLIAILVAFVLVWNAKTTITETSMIIFTGLALICSDDAKFLENFFGKKPE